MGQMTWKKNMPAIAAAHKIPYVATACPSYPIDLVQKVKKAANTEGPAYLHILAVCPTGWKSAPDLSIKLGRLAVETGVFPLYEVEKGRYRLSMDFQKLRPIKEYLKPQGRFRHLTESMIEEIEKQIHLEYQELKVRAGQAG
jgi:pyruvate ferredoxin oxidoreductase beta subunit